LKRLPVDELKIDRTFVAGMTNGEDEDSAIVRSTVELARTLGLHGVAEGVENQATWDLLRGFGCHAAQGYLLSRPMVASRFQEWLTLYHEHLGDITHTVALGDDAFSS
jgi:diguanylate cyclase